VHASVELAGLRFLAVITILVLYAAGVAVALWRTDGPAAIRVILATLWPLGPLAFALTVTLLIGASLIAFPTVGVIVAGSTLAWWLFV